MATVLYVNPDPATQDRATSLGCGWMPEVPPQYASVATAPCVIVSGQGTTTVLPDPTTAQAVSDALAPILAAEQAVAATAAQQQANATTIDANLTALITSLQADVTQDQSIIAGANPIIASTGTLSSATLSANVRSLATAVKALANNDINNKRALANLLRKIQGDYTDLTGT